jgi:hypothetical protein
MVNPGNIPALLQLAWLLGLGRLAAKLGPFVTLIFPAKNGRGEVKLKTHKVLLARSEVYLFNKRSNRKKTKFPIFNNNFTVFYLIK